MIPLGCLRFGPSGYPSDAKGSLERVFEILKSLKLDALEYAATYGLRLGEQKAEEIGKLARATDVSMSMHAPYYISLASNKEEIRERSKKRVVKALCFAPLMNVKRIVFHPGGYVGHTPEEAFMLISKAILDIWEEAGHLGKGAVLAPEIAGKKNAFGSPGEIIRLCVDTEGCIPTIDWAHLYARTRGEINDRDSYGKVLAIFEDALGDTFTKNLHFHVSGITFTNAGEKAHRPLGSKWGPDILPLIELLNELGYDATIISETPEPVRGALYAKYLLEELEK